MITLRRHLCCSCKAQLSVSRARTYTKPVRSKAQQKEIAKQLDQLFDKPRWSVKSLLPKHGTEFKDVQPINAAQIQQLLRLSAFEPLEAGPPQENLMKDLTEQLHFVREAQEVDTEDVDPLQNLTADQPEEQEMDYDEVLRTAEEMKQGKFRPAVDYTKLSRKTKNRYFTVDGGLVNRTKDDSTKDD